ncbi:hypothetical protein XELAEV_18021029mg [Xenopus laevis]|uniref:FZ domain-containing protein n=1 Tax=Xenopus laevis TaxID=8355 RepID=A0A974HRK0_XENLA|nr:hypothetical protein XELAEV_18021029mg [Xenopus laevis]
MSGVFLLLCASMLACTAAFDIGLSTKCVTIPTEMAMCNDVGYSEMRLPNLMGHTNMAEVVPKSAEWQNLLQTGCHPYARTFLCSLFAPVCLDTFIQPCRSMCVAVRDSCAPVLACHGHSWPESLDCDRFPAGEDMCLDTLSKEYQYSYKEACRGNLFHGTVVHMGGVRRLKAIHGPIKAANRPSRQLIGPSVGPSDGLPRSISNRKSARCQSSRAKNPLGSWSASVLLMWSHDPTAHITCIMIRSLGPMAHGQISPMLPTLRWAYQGEIRLFGEIAKRADLYMCGHIKAAFIDVYSPGRQFY